MDHLVKYENMEIGEVCEKTRVIGFEIDREAEKKENLKKIKESAKEIGKTRAIFSILFN